MLIICKILISFICLNVSANDVLQIMGPREAYEGEEVEFYVTLNNEPIQARITFGDSLIVDWTNSSTGKIILTMPLVSNEEQEFVINASIPGGLNVSYLVLVRNRTNYLEFEFFPEYIIEMTVFNVSVKYRREPVEDATVSFNSAKYTTDSNGNVTLTAPDVLTTTNYGIDINKIGYKSNSTFITIYENNFGLKLIDITYPFIVETGEENIEINVFSKNGGLENVTLEVYYEESKQSEFKTDINGNAYIQIPLINNDNYFSILVSKNGYRTYNDNNEIIINFFTRDLNHDLEISINPSELYEGEMVIVEVKDESGNSIEDVEIWRGSKQIDIFTDSNGISEFIAPAVFMDKEYYIYAIKKGYNFAEDKITVRDSEYLQEKLIIETKNSINELDIFNVTIKDEKGVFINRATVLFNSEQQITEENGIVFYTAPNVTMNTLYDILANKYGYLPASVSIEILNQDDTNGVSNNTFKLCFPPNVMENDNFTIIVKNEQDDLIYGAQVIFMDITKYTDYKGSVSFNTPDINWDEIQEILVTKSNYESISVEINIINKEEFQYWFLLIVILIIIFVGFISFFKYRQMI